MSKIVTNLKQKTEQEKVVLAVITAVIVTVFLFVTWGYNFAHSGKINNLASSAASVADTVDDMQIKENFNSALKQFDQIKNVGNTSGTVGTDGTDKINTGSGVGSQYINVFANPDGATGSSPEYGENKADVLY